MTGWVICTADLPKGTCLKRSYGEILQEGVFYRENLRDAKARFQYTSDGSKRIIRPHFTYSGFRYVKVEGIIPNPDDFTGVVLHTHLENGMSAWDGPVMPKSTP